MRALLITEIYSAGANRGGLLAATYVETPLVVVSVVVDFSYGFKAMCHRIIPLSERSQARTRALSQFH